MMRPSETTSTRSQIAEQLFKIRNRDHNGRALCGDFGNDAANIRLGADIDAGGRLIEQEHPAICGERAAESDFLRIAAA